MKKFIFALLIAFVGVGIAYAASDKKKCDRPCKKADTELVCGDKKPCCKKDTTVCPEKKPCCGDKKPCCKKDTTACPEKKPCCGDKKPCCKKDTSVCPEKKPCCGKKPCGKK